MKLLGPVVGVEIDGQFVVTAAQVLDERVSCDILY
jgi:hypothetical protein